MSAFDKRVSYTAKCPDFTAALHETPRGQWRAEVTFLQKGRMPLDYTFTSFESLKTHLNSLSDLKVIYSREVEEVLQPGQRSGSTEARKQIITEKAADKTALAPALAPTGGFYFSDQLKEQFVQAILIDFAQKYPKKLLANDYNFSVLIRYIQEFALGKGFYFDDKHTQILKIVDWLHTQKMLIAEGNHSPQPFRTVAQVEEDAREAVGQAESETVKRRRGLSLEELLVELKIENPNLKLGDGVDPKILYGGGTIFTETTTRASANRGQWTAEDKKTRQLSDAELKKAYQASLRKK